VAAVPPAAVPPVSVQSAVIHYGAGQAGVMAARARIGTDFVFDTGQRIRAGQAGLLGRNPSSTDTTLVCTTVNDPDLSISKNHLEYGTTAAGLWVKDRHSTNGSTITHPGGEPVALAPGQETPVAIGDIVTIGRRTFHMEAVAQ